MVSLLDGASDKIETLIVDREDGWREAEVVGAIALVQAL